jgi:hypothetical protein
MATRPPFSNKRSDDPAWFTGTAFPLWAGDLRFTLNQIAAWNDDRRGLFFHRLDLTRVGAFGHSFGVGVLRSWQRSMILA